MMTKSKFLYAVLGMSLLFTLGACQSLVDDLNNDPNNFTTITLPLALNQAQLNQASVAGGFPSHIAAMWADQFTGSDRQYISYDNYAITAGNFDDTWEDLYQRGVVHAQIAKGIAAEQGASTSQGAATIMEAYYFAEAALMFGDVPFGEANQINEFTDPNYEGQEAVLRGSVALLDEALGLVGSDPVSTTGGGIYTTGASWAQVANAFKARYLLALMDYDGAYAAAVASGMDTPGEDLSIFSSTNDFGENLYWQFEIEQRTSYLTVDNEARGMSYFRSLLSDTTANSRNTGDAKTDDAARYAYFIEVNDAFADNVRFNVTDGFAAQTAPLLIIGSAEVQGILAEAAARGTAGTGAAVDGLNAARNYWDMKLGGDSYQDYIEADFASTNDLIMAILVEKFVGVIGLPTFYDLNRTNNMIGTTSEASSDLARRFIYPSTEISSNSNFPGLEDLTTPLPLYQ